MPSSSWHLAVRAWGAMITASSTSTFGIFCWLFGVAVAIWVAQVSYTWTSSLKTNRDQATLANAIKNTVPRFLWELGALVTLVLLVWTVFIVRTVYYLHTGMRYEYVQEVKRNQQLMDDLEFHRHSLATGDPVFGNTIYLLQAFQIYRTERGGKPCVMYFTSTPDSFAIASMVAQFSNSVSGCFTFGPDPNGNPDLRDMEKAGMIPGVIVVHVKRDDHFGISFQERLGNQIQTRLSYTPPTIPKDHLYAGSCCGYSEDFIWLQFGTGTKWNSEIYQAARK